MIDMKDTGSERALLATIVKSGKDAFIDADDIMSASDLSLGLNRAIYLSLKDLSDDPDCDEFDIESIKLKMKSLGFGEYLNSNKNLEYIDLLNESSFDTKNIQLFAYQIKKYAVVRELYNKYKDATGYLENISGNEKLSEIIQNAEGKIVDYINGIDSGESLARFGENIEEYIQQMIEEEEVDQIGLPTGYPIWDNAIGGGFRKATVNTIVARSKVGKSFSAMNIGANVASKGTKVLYLDTELTEKPQKDRLIPIVSGCPMYLFETRKFKHDKDLRNNVIEAAKEINSWPFFYQQIGGKNHNEALTIAKRWLVKHVGFDQRGKANPCLIIYDYMKLTGEVDLSKAMPEYIALGMLITCLHDFCLKYEIPMLGMIQSNRSGISSEETDIVAGSDRILWLSSSLSILKNKEETDLDLGCGWEYGNKKLIPIATRYGSGLEKYGDYINIKASLNPNVNKYQATGSFREGLLFSEITNVQNIPREDRGNQGNR